MRTLHEQPATSDMLPAEAEVLIREARHLRRRRWSLGAALLLLAVIGAVTYAISSSPPGNSSTSGTNSARPYFPGTASDRSNFAASARDLLAPVSLAIEPNGDLLIADEERNQILLRSPQGRLSVFAGTGKVGDAGDGGKAVAAEFEGLGDMVLSSTGTLYVADSKLNGDCRIRAIADGRIRTLTSGICNASLALSPQGVLYASNGESIYRISANGATTKLAVTSPTPQQWYGGSAATFSPCRMAFEPNGDLVVDSGYLLELVTPAGVMRPLDTSMGGDCNLDGATTTSTGQVLIAMRGGRLESVVGSRMTALRTLEPNQIDGYKADRVGDWDVSDIVTSANGNAYAVAEDQALSTNVIQLVKIPVSGRPSVLPISTPLGTTLPKLGSSAFPRSLYPRPVSSSGAGLSTCPNPQGIEPFNASARDRLGSLIATLHQSDLLSGLTVTDPSWWSGLFTSLEVFTLPLPSNTSNTSIAAASTDSLSRLIAANCGEQLVSDSLVVTYVIGGVSIKDEYFVLDRNGRPLLYLQSSNS
jgi:hypothetical protein